MPADDKPLSPESMKLLELFAGRIDAQIKGAQLAISNEVQAARSDMTRQLEATEGRIGKTLDEIKEDQREQHLSLEQQGRDLTEVKTRLSEGEKRFDDHSQRIEKIEAQGATKAEVQALEERVEKVEEKQSKNSVGLAAMAGAAVGGGGGGSIITHLLGG